jgi:hypothetical protein
MFGKFNWENSAILPDANLKTVEAAVSQLMARNSR